MKHKWIKYFIVNTLLSWTLCGETSATQDYTNGVYVENGKTIEIDRTVHEIVTTNSTETLYFSNGLIVEVGTNADFTINSFYQEVLNTNFTPEKLKSKTHNFAATLTKGIIVVTYAGGDENSSCTISTPLTDYELSKGTFVFQVDETCSIVFSLDGSVKATGGRNTVTTTEGNYTVARPNSIGVLEAKVFLNTDKTPQNAQTKLLLESQEVTKLKDCVMFIRIDGKIVGVVIN